MIVSISIASAMFSRISAADSWGRPYKTSWRTGISRKNRLGFGAFGCKRRNFSTSIASRSGLVALAKIGNKVGPDFRPQLAVSVTIVDEPEV
ncbi:hypothetical protein GGS26DRAFT_536804 [Hypomontagnella submonticulosa]|nr:hypothetical protein GGS26DRAFT_536804 [Hypomontagnella submonticulosa]